MRIEPANAAFLTTGPPPMPRARPVGDRPAHLLLEREEEPGRDDEHEDPQAVERRVLGLVECLEGEDLEAVRGEARDQEAEPDGVGAFGQRHLASSLDDALCALRHFADPEWPEWRSRDGTERPSEREQHTGVVPATRDRGSCQWTDAGGGRATMHAVSTRTLLILAAITGVAILAAGAIQILLAR